MKGNQFIMLVLGLCSLVASVGAFGAIPSQFFVITNSPILGPAQETLYLYAIHTTPLVSPDQIEFAKGGGLVSETVQTGIISSGPNTYGCFLTVGLPNRYRATRYGTYDATFTPSDGSATVMRSGFVRRPSDILDTRGVYTYTVWPMQSGESQIVRSPDNNIGVRWTPGCRSIQWCKGKKRNVNTGPRLELKTTDDAGVYTLRRGKRGARGWFVQIEVIAAKCQMNEYDDSGCTSRTGPACENGGVARDAEDNCICPPYFGSSDCTEKISVDFALTHNGAVSVVCGDLPGGNPKCRGYLICFGDLYGCKCAPGWWGSNCDQSCPKGKWGAGCSQTCPDFQDCNRFFGI